MNTKGLGTKELHESFIYCFMFKEKNSVLTIREVLLENKKNIFQKKDMYVAKASSLPTLSCKQVATIHYHSLNYHVILL